MKARWLVAVTVVILVGCSAQPRSKNSLVWQAYGYEEAVAGQEKLTILKGELADSYSQGYEVGRQEYCEQDAFELGKLQRPYHGICDEINPDFRAAYSEGAWWDHSDFSD